MTADPESGENPRLERLILWPRFTGAQWQLPSQLSRGARLLIAWKVLPAALDGEAPQLVAQLLTAALLRHATLTFAAALSPPRGAGTLPRSWRLNRHFLWTSTADQNQAARGIFYADAFSWSLQGQIVLLSAPGRALALDESYLDLPSDPARFDELARVDGALGVLLPGVDGQMAGLYVFDDSLAGALQSELGARATALGAACAVTLDELDFVESLRDR